VLSLGVAALENIRLQMGCPALGWLRMKSVIDELIVVKLHIKALWILVLMFQSKINASSRWAKVSCLSLKWQML